MGEGRCGALPHSTTLVDQEKTSIGRAKPVLIVRSFGHAFVKERLEKSLEEEDERPPFLDKKFIYKVGDHEEVIDLEEDEFNLIEEKLDSILKHDEDNNNGQVKLFERKELVATLSMEVNVPKKSIWDHIKDYTGWTNSNTELKKGQLKYKIKY